MPVVKTPGLGTDTLDVTIVAHDVGDVGGMERQLTELIIGLLERGQQVTVISRSCGLAPRQGLRWLRVLGPSRPFPIAYPWFIMAGSAMTALHHRGLTHVTGAIILNRADVASVHLCHAAIQRASSVVRSRRPGPLYAISAHLSAAMSQAFESWYYRRRVRGAVVAVSAGVAAELKRFYPVVRDLVRVIPNAVRHETFARSEPDRLRLRSELRIGQGRLVALFVGGEWEGKGLGYVVDAVAKFSDSELIVVGAGDEARIRARQTWPAVGDRVRFVGRTQSAPYYSAADVFVLPSVYEAAPLVVYEAAAAGLPLLSTRVHGIEAVLEHGDNGWFIERDAGMIAARLRQLHQDPSLLIRMSVRSRLASTRCAWPAVIDAYADVYRELQGRGEPSWES